MDDCDFLAFPADLDMAVFSMLSKRFFSFYLAKATVTSLKDFLTAGAGEMIETG